MLNRLFVAIGVLVILTIATAFFVPRFIQWGDYRPRLEKMASDAFGTPVAIEGDISLVLLPQPELHFSQVRVGPADAPVMQIAGVAAQFSLLDFLRDQYDVIRLELDQPVMNFSIGADGTLGQTIELPQAGAQSNVSISNAQVVDGAIRVSDARSGQAYAAEALNGQLAMQTLQGPYGFQGQTRIDGTDYAVHVATGRSDAGTTLSLYVQPFDKHFTLQADGALQPGASPRFVGTTSYSQVPPGGKPGEAVDLGRGNFSLDGKVDAGTDKILLTSFTALPDANRPATRLTGAGELDLGKAVTFNTVISGGVVALPPRDATKELTDPPYELVRLLGETPLPPVPPIPGKVGLDVSQLDLRAVSLRDVRLDAETDGKAWTIKTLTANLPGNTIVGLSGTLMAASGRPVFAGDLSVSSQQLDRLTALYRKPPEGDPLLDTQGSLSADVALSGDTLTLSSGRLVVGDVNQGFTADIGFGTQRSLKLDAHLSGLDTDQSAAFAALLPDITGNGSFGATFPKGDISLSADKAVLFGLDGSGLAADASWDGGVLTFSKLTAQDLGGASFDGTLTAFGTLLKPQVSGKGTLKIAANAPALAQTLSSIGAPQPVADFLKRSLPASLDLTLDAPTGDGAQALSATGTLSASAATLTAKFAAGVVNALTSPINATLDLSTGSPHLLVSQIGLGDTPLFDEGSPLALKASVSGTPSSSYQVQLALAGGHDHLGFAGSVNPGDFTSLTGAGDIDVALSDPSAIATALGMDGLYVPPVTGKASLSFDGLDKLELTKIEADQVGGALSIVRNAGKTTVGGSLALPAFDVKELLPYLVGVSGTLNGPDSLWPDGPIDLGSTSRTSEGRINLTSPSLSIGGTSFSDAKFGLDWDAQSIHLRSLSGKVGGGTGTIDATLCCSGTSTSVKQISGRLALDGVDVAAIAPPAISDALKGKLQTSAEFSGTGATLSEAIGSLTGSGSFTIGDFSVAHFDPSLVAGLSSLTNVLNTEPDVLSANVTDSLAAAPFTSASVTGSFNVAGGVVRSPDLTIDGGQGKLFGSTSLALPTLAIDGHYTLSPTTKPDDKSPVDPNSAEVAANVTGTLWAPSGAYDVASLVEGMKIKASEAELAHLEELKAEADARAKAAADADASMSSERAASEASVSSASEASAEAAASSSAEAAASSSAAAAASSSSAEASRQAAAAASSSSAEASKQAASSSAQSASSKDLGM